MEIKYPIAIIIASVTALIFLIVFIIQKKQKKKFKDGVKIAGTAWLAEDKYFRKKVKTRRIFMALAMIFGCLAIAFSGLLISRRQKTEKIANEKFCRDIILCLDISSSVDQQNLQIVKSLQDIVSNLKGERFGIIIFNTSPVLLAPLTDDYEYVLNELKNIETGLRVRLGSSISSTDSYLYWTDYLMAGTLVDNENRGSSLIGDGLASTVFNFSSKDAERPRVVIFSTDNELNGTEYVTLQEAGELCKKNKITVFGIGTDDMYKKNRESMKSAVEVTGGKFYDKTSPTAIRGIVKDIEATSANLTKVQPITKETDYPMLAFILLLISTAGLVIAGRMVKL